jgi:hypothetical protein
MLDQLPRHPWAIFRRVASGEGGKIELDYEQRDLFYLLKRHLLPESVSPVIVTPLDNPASEFVK